MSIDCNMLEQSLLSDDNIGTTDQFVAKHYGVVLFRKMNSSYSKTHITDITTLKLFLTAAYLAGMVFSSCKNSCTQTL